MQLHGRFLLVFTGILRPQGMNKNRSCFFMHVRLPKALQKYC